MYHIDQNSKTPLHIQLFEALKKDIIDNYQVEEKLPSIRKVASTYNLSKNTVENAYSQLVAEGYIDSVPKSGYVVVENNYIDFSDEFNCDEKGSKKDEEVLYDFYPACLEKENFPIKLWKRLFNKTIDETVDMGKYSDRQGEFELREQIATYLNQSRAVKCNASQVVLGNGFISSMSLICMILKNLKTLAMEEPGYHVARRTFENHDFKIDRINVNQQGINLKELEETKAKLLYITPSHQYPTGVAIPISNRLKLLEWANKTKSYIIEDDYDSELSYINRPIPSLQGLDKNQRVIYTGTFSKALSPALRISYMVLPKELLDIYKQQFYYYDSGVCLLTQKTLTQFIKQGHWDKHLRKTRTQNKKKHNLLKKLLEKKLANSMKIVSQGGGLSILIQATKSFNYEKLLELGRKNKINLYPAKPRSGGNFQAIMMGFGGLKEEELEKAITAFSKIWFDCFD